MCFSSGQSPATSILYGIKKIHCALFVWIHRWTAEAYANGTCLKIDSFDPQTCPVPGHQGIQEGRDLCVNVRPIAASPIGSLSNTFQIFFAC